MAINILLTDTGSPLGSGLRQRFESTTHRFVAEHPADLDWRDSAQVAEYLDQVAPHLILNTTGWGEGAAVKPELLVAGARSLAQAVGGRDCAVVHLSSYRVFHGEGRVSHKEADVPKAETELSQVFSEAESLLAEAMPRVLCLRSSWVLSTVGGSLLARLLADFQAGRATVVSDHWRGTPVLVNDVVRAVYAITQQIIYGADNWGVMHFGSSDVCSELVFAQKVREMIEAEIGQTLQLEELETPTDNSAVLELRRVRDNFGIQPRSWRQGLRPALKSWLKRTGYLEPAKAS